MIRKILSGNHHKPEANSKRDKEIQRIETFSDAVFAFAVTLLIVSLEVPKNFEELLVNMRGFFAFGISFILLIFIWNEQHKFFRRYGLDDTWTITLNMILLFIVLFYVYPLKFLFTLIFSPQIYGPQGSPLRITQEQVPLLMEIYALGYIAIYFLFFCMYLQALKKSEILGLSPIEKFDCKTSMYKQLVMVGVGCVSLILAATLSASLEWLAGFIYVMIGPALTLFYTLRGKMRRSRY